MMESDTVNMAKTKYAVFYEKETIGNLGMPTWTMLFFGYERRVEAMRCFDWLSRATNIGTRRARGFKNLHVCEKREDVWHEIRR
jgi:hypothetical protein